VILQTNTFSALSYIFNLTQWIGFKIVTEAQVKGDYNYYKRQIAIRNKVLTIITVTIMVSSLFVSGSLFFLPDVNNMFRYFMLAVFTITQIGILFVCITLCNTLKKYYPSFYQTQKIYIIGL